MNIDYLKEHPPPTKKTKTYTRLGPVLIPSKTEVQT